ncbi:hypothetical protein ACFE04_010356 [Oxalis oulophora]
MVKVWPPTAAQTRGNNTSSSKLLLFDMQHIGKFLSFASKGDRIGLNQMLREGISPDVQDYDNRTALHLAASEGHAPIVELLLFYDAHVNLIDRWQRTPLTDARLYGHRDICRILEVNGGKEFSNDQQMPVRHDQDTIEVSFDISELDTQQTEFIDQGIVGVSEKVKWHGTWVIKTLIHGPIQHHENMQAWILSATDNTPLRQLRHPNILQFLGSFVQGNEMTLITEYLPEGNLNKILKQRVRLDLPTALRYALDIARNLLQDEAGHLKIGEYWVQMLNKQTHLNQEIGQNHEDSSVIRKALNDAKKDIHSFGFIFYQMLEGRLISNTKVDYEHLSFSDFQPKFQMSKCPLRMQQLIEHCTSKDPSVRPTFSTVIEILEEVELCLGRGACPVC